MSSKPTHTTYIVIDPKEGSDKKAQWIEVGAVWSHSDGRGFDIVVPNGIASRAESLPQAQGTTSHLILTPRRNSPAGLSLSAQEI
jgi:hypothetical protein